MYQKWTLKRHTVVSVVHIDCGLGNRVLPVTASDTSLLSSLPASVRDARGKAEWDTCSPRGGSVARLLGFWLASRCMGERRGSDSLITGGACS
jgi:hypothetical protein